MQTIYEGHEQLKIMPGKPVVIVAAGLCEGAMSTMRFHV
jgi:hypothetical protein